MIIYRLLRALLRIAVWVFFKSIQVDGRKELPREGPLIVAVNHPNTLMDPVVVVLLLKQQTGFLANAGIFANALLKWLFTRLHLIPVYRQQDVKEGQVADNASSFRRCYDYLLKKGTLMIFPEGSSVHEMKLRKLKTGTARIALETAALANFSSGLLISPISLTYADPNRFRSRLYIKIAAPIQVDAYGADYRADPIGAVQSLTVTLREKLQKNLITASYKGEEILLMRIRKLYRDHLVENAPEPLSKYAEFELLQQIGNGLAYYREYRPDEYHQLSYKIARYFNEVEENGLKEGFLSPGFNAIKQWLLLVANLFFLILLFPLFVGGLLSNYIPYMLPAKIALALGTDIEYRAGIMMLSGLLLFPFYYGLCIWIFHAVVDPAWYFTFLFAWVLPLLGFFVLQYWRVAAITCSLIKFMSLSKAAPLDIQGLCSLRSNLKHELETAADLLNRQGQMEQKGVIK